MDVSRDLTFGCVKADSRPRSELLDYVQHRDHIIDGVGDKCSVVGLPFAGKFESTGSDVIDFVRNIKLADQGLDNEIEKEGGERVALKGAGSDSHRLDKAVGGDEASGNPAIEVGDQACEVLGKTQEISDPDQLFVVCGEEGPFEVEVAKDDILF